MRESRGKGPRGPNPAMRRKPNAASRRGMFYLLKPMRDRKAARRAP